MEYGSVEGEMGKKQHSAGQWKEGREESAGPGPLLAGDGGPAKLATTEMEGPRFGSTHAHNGPWTAITSTPYEAARSPQTDQVLSQS